MRMHDAARRFHDSQAYDGYTGQPVFKCAFSAYDDSSADGATTRRRVLNLTPRDVVPARRVVTLHGERWLVGAGTPDAFAGTEIRRSYGMKKASDLVSLLTPAQACLAAAGVDAYVQKYYFKDTANNLTDGKIDTFWNVFVAPGEPVVPGTFLLSGDQVLRARNTYLPIEGLRIAQCDALDSGAFQAITFATGAYDPLTDAYAGSTLAVPSYSLDFPKLYRFRTEADPRQMPGDLSVLVPATLLTPSVGQAFTANGQVWRVLTVQPELDCWLLQARRG